MAAYPLFLFFFSDENSMQQVFRLVHVFNYVKILLLEISNHPFPIEVAYDKVDVAKASMIHR